MAYNSQQAPGNLDTDGLRRFVEEQFLAISRATAESDKALATNLTAINASISSINTSIAAINTNINSSLPVTTILGSNFAQTNTTELMAGFGANNGWTYTPTGSSLLALVPHQINIASTSQNTVVQMRYGTGTPPAKNAAPAGTSFYLGSAASIVGTDGQTGAGVISGLTPGVPVWIDLSTYNVVGGALTYNIFNPRLIIVDLKR